MCALSDNPFPHPLSARQCPDHIRKFCTNGCQLFSYVGDSDWLSKVTVQENGVVIQRYLYANGRPLRVDIPYVWWINPWYYRYNARGGDTFTDTDGNGATKWASYGAWGDINFCFAYPAARIFSCAHSQSSALNSGGGGACV